jgi:hypothetical protein
LEYGQYNHSLALDEFVDRVTLALGEVDSHRVTRRAVSLSLTLGF